MGARIIATAIAAAALASTATAQEAGLQRTITFDDLAPPGMALQQCWNATGMDASGKVHIGFTARRGDGRDPPPAVRLISRQGFAALSPG